MNGRSTIDQTFGDTASVYQTSSAVDAVSIITQGGAWVNHANSASVVQSGTTDKSTITQTGTNMLASVNQSGIVNASTISQTGDFHTAVVSQASDGVVSTITQTGAGNVTYVSQ